MALSGYPMMHGGFYGMMGFGWLFQLLIFIIFFLLVWWLLKGGNIGAGTGGGQDPKTILKARLAKGEITKKEYESLKDEIEKD